MRKIVSILCALLLVLGTTQVVFASAPEETPPPPATDNNEYNTPYDPVGEYSPEELQSLQSSQPQPRNPFMPLYVHEIIAITKTYKGDRDEGIVATCTPSPAITHLSYI